MKKRRPNFIVCIASSAFFCWMPLASAQTAEQDVKFSRELNRLELYNYSENYLIQRYSSGPVKGNDLLRAQLMDTYLVQHKLDPALKLLKGFNASNKAGAAAYASIGKYYVSTGKYADGVKYLSEFYEYLKKNPKEKDEFQEALNYLLEGFKRTGNAAKAQEVLEWYQSNDTDVRSKAYTKCKFRLDAIVEQKKAADAQKNGPSKAVIDDRMKKFDNRMTLGKDELARLKKLTGDWHAELLATMFELDGIQWAGQDVLTAFSAVLMGRCYYIMGDYEKCISSIKYFDELFDGCDESFKADNRIAESPSASAKLWIGKANFAIAEEFEAKKDVKNAAKYYQRAFKNYGMLLRDYPDCPDGVEAYGEFNNAIDKLVKLKPELKERLAAEKAKISPPGNKEGGKASENLMPALAEKEFNDKKYESVIEQLIPIVVEKRTHPSLAKVLGRLAVSYAKTGKKFEAFAICSLMADKFPKDPYTANALIECGNTSIAEAEALKKQKNGAASTKAMDEGLEFFSMFLAADPANSSAPAIAMYVAKEYYNRAKASGDRLNALTDNAARINAREEWLKAYETALKALAFVSDNYATTPEVAGPACLLAANCYTVTERYVESANMYKKFCASDIDDPKNMVKAKVNVADSLYRAGDAKRKEARALREEAAGVVPVSAGEKPVPPEGIDVNNPASATTDEQKTQLEKYTKDLEKYEAAVKEAKVQEQKKQDFISDAEELEKQAEVIFKESLAVLEDFTSNMAAPGSKMAAAIGKTPDFAGAVKRAEALYPWLYEGLNDKKKAISFYNDYIAKYKGDNLIPAYMMRVGVLYTELGQDDRAQVVLTELSNKFPKTNEGRNAKFYLARNLYTGGSYSKSIKIFNEIFAAKDLRDNLNIRDLRWIAAELAACPSKTSVKDASGVSLKASEMLLEALQNPDDKEWVGDLNAANFRADPVRRKEFYDYVNEKTNLDAGKAALVFGKYDDAVKYFSAILKRNENTQFFNDVHFGRAEAYQKLGKGNEARADLSEITARANQLRQYNVYNKGQTLIGLSYLAEDNVKKAFALFNIVAMPAFKDGETTPEKLKALDPDGDTAEYVERAIYLAAKTADKLGKTSEKKAMVEKYNKFYPKGRYRSEVSSLAAEQEKTN